MMGYWSSVTGWLRVARNLKMLLFAGAAIVASGAVFYVVHTIKQAGAAQAEIARLNDVLERNRLAMAALEESHQQVTELSRGASVELAESEDALEALRLERLAHARELDQAHAEKAAAYRAMKDSEAELQLTQAELSKVRFFQGGGAYCPTGCWYTEDE